MKDRKERVRAIWKIGLIALLESHSQLDVNKRLTDCMTPSEEALWTAEGGGGGSAAAAGGWESLEDTEEEAEETSVRLRISRIKGRLSAKSLSDAFNGTRLTDSPAGDRFS